jgi:hypothetical protein
MFRFSRTQKCEKSYRQADEKAGAAGFKTSLAFPGKLWTILSKLLQDKGAEKTKRAMQAMLQTDKIDIDQLKQAAEKGQVEC